MTFTATHTLTRPVTQGVRGPQRPPVTFPAGTPVGNVVALGDLAYADTEAGWTIVVRVSEEIRPIVAVVR